MLVVGTIMDVFSWMFSLAAKRAGQTILSFSLPGERGEGAGLSALPSSQYLLNIIPRIRQAYRAVPRHTFILSVIGLSSAGFSTVYSISRLIDTVLDALQIKLVNIHESDIVDGNHTVILGLIWIIILHFQVD